MNNNNIKENLEQELLKHESLFSFNLGIVSVLSFPDPFSKIHDFQKSLIQKLLRDYNQNLHKKNYKKAIDNLFYMLNFFDYTSKEIYENRDRFKYSVNQNDISFLELNIFKELASCFKDYFTKICNDFRAKRTNGNMEIFDKIDIFYNDLFNNLEFIVEESKNFYKEEFKNENNNKITYNQDFYLSLLSKIYINPYKYFSIMNINDEERISVKDETIFLYNKTKEFFKQFRNFFYK